MTPEEGKMDTVFSSGIVKSSPLFPEDNQPFHGR
jgi:hypothetical protein